MAFTKIPQAFVEHKVYIVNCFMAIIAIIMLIYSIYVNINYGLIAFSSLPHADDWAFIDLLRAYRETEISFINYIFTPHNGHPAVPARVAFLLSEIFHDLNLEYLRWITLLLQYLCLVFAISFVILSTYEHADVRATSLNDIVANPLVSPALLAVITLVFLSTSLIDWETFAYAMGVTNIIVVMSALGALAAFQGYLVFSKPKWLLVATIIFSTISTFSMSQGIFIWFALAVAGLMRAPREYGGLSFVFGAIFMVGFTIFILTRGDAGSEIGALTQLPVRTLGLLGLPWFPDLPDTTFHINIRVLIGVLVAIALAWLSLGALADTAAFFRANAIAIAVLIFGGLTMLAILASRGSFDLPLLLAPRYAQLLLPVAIGFVAMALASSTQWGGGRLILTAVGAVAFIGWSLSISVETMMAPHRASAHDRMEAYILDGDPTDTEVTPGVFYFDEFYANNYYPRSIDYLKTNDLGPFASDQ